MRRRAGQTRDHEGQVTRRDVLTTGLGLGAAALTAAVLPPTGAGAAAPLAPALGAPDWVKQGRHGGSITFYVPGQPELWDPHRGATIGTAAPTRSLYNGLVMYNPVPPTDQIIGDLAKSWQVSADGMAYTFHLHDNATWWDGKPVTADDVVFSLNRMVEQGQPRPRTGALRPYYQRAQALDPTTVQVHLQFPAAAFLPLLAADYMMILPRHVVQAGVDINVPQNIVGSGPFKPAGFVRGVSYAFEKNPAYFKKGLPFLDSVKVIVIVDQGRAIAAMQTEQVMGNVGHTAGPELEAARALERDSGGRVRSLPIMVGPHGVFVNFKKKPFDDPRVRRAMNLALDRRELNQAGYGGAGLAASAFLPGTAVSAEEVAQWPGYRSTPDGQKDPRDIAEARRLLAEAGYVKGFEATYLYTPGWPEPVLAPFVKEELGRIGIRLTLRQMESSARAAALASGEYDIANIRHGITVSDPDEIFTSIYLAGGARNQLGYEDPRMREIFEQQTRETDPARRKALLRQAEEIIKAGEYHWFTLLWTSRFVMKNVKVQNYYPNPTIHTGNTLEHLWYDPTARP